MQTYAYYALTTREEMDAKRKEFWGRIFELYRN